MGMPHEPRTRVAIIGAGRMGRALVRACRRAEVDLVGVVARSEESRRWMRDVGGIEAVEDLVGLATLDVDVFVLAVPDDAILDVVGRLAASTTGSPLVVVTSGAVSIGTLAEGAGQLRLARVHPMQTITLAAGPGVLDGVTAAVTALPEDCEAAHRMAELLGMVPFDLRDEDAPTWHAAGVLAAGAVTTLIAASRELAVAAGLEPGRALDTVVALARTAVAQAGVEGPARAMTGPAVRGDAATIAAHVDALEAHDPELRAAYVALTRVALRVARDAGRIDEAAAAAAAAADDVLGEVPAWA